MKQMNDYECCRCGTIFRERLKDGVKELLCPICGSAAREVEDLIKHEDELDPKVRVEDTDWWREVRTVITDMLYDHRINGEVRKEYQERIKQVQG